MSITQRLFGSGNTDSVESATETNTTDERWLSEAAVNGLEYLFTAPLPAAFDMTRDQNYEFAETVTITPNENNEFVTIHIQTPTADFDFDVRITGYTSRFGTLDAEYISVGSYAVDVYYPQDDSDSSYFVRRLYYYEDEQGIGAEQHRDNSSSPSNPNWNRETDLNKTVQVEETVSRVRVYDWREQMLTHDKPTPAEGQVVLLYQDSPNCGGNRTRENIVLNVDDIKSPVGDELTVEFIQFNTDDGTFVLYAKIDSNKWAKLSVPARENASVEEVEWTVVSEALRPSKVDDLVWVREPGDTWTISRRSRTEKIL